jgi:hypothetical protein
MAQCAMVPCLVLLGWLLGKTSVDLRPLDSKGKLHCTATPRRASLRLSKLDLCHWLYEM